MNSIRDAFESFMQREFYHAVVMGTKVLHDSKSTVTTNFFVELFHDGKNRLIPGSAIGNNYKTPGLIMRIPTMTYEEWYLMHKSTYQETIIVWADIHKAATDGVFERVIKKFRRQFENSLLEF